MKTLPLEYKQLDDATAVARIHEVRARLGARAFILGHNYQRDEVYQFADATGDSLALSRLATQQEQAEFIVFCGVHFMAETADILNHGQKIVTLPDLTAGCPMADMAPPDLVKKSWHKMIELVGETIVPVAYINCYASLKAFVGENGGAICTSSNAEKIMRWAFSQKEKIFFLPDQNLGYNVGRKMGLKPEEMVVWDPLKRDGGLTQAQLEKAKLILWKGCCPVHQKFEVAHVEKWRTKGPEYKILVHPECTPEVVAIADLVGSTSYIIDQVAQSPAGSKWVVATELHLVSRLAKDHPDKEIYLLSPPTCMCSMMDRTSPQDLLWNLELLEQGDFVTHRITVPDEIRAHALLGLERMMDLS